MRGRAVLLAVIAVIALAGAAYVLFFSAPLFDDGNARIQAILSENSLSFSRLALGDFIGEIEYSQLSGADSGLAAYSALLEGSPLLEGRLQARDVSALQGEISVYRDLIALAGARKRMEAAALAVDPDAETCSQLDALRETNSRTLEFRNSLEAAAAGISLFISANHGYYERAGIESLDYGPAAIATVIEAQDAAIAGLEELC